MLVDCPKCGFNQPQDQYCAQCGVDMERYRNRPKPLVQRLVNSPYFHGGIALLVAILLGAYLYNSQKSEIDKRLRQALSVPVAQDIPPPPAPDLSRQDTAPEPPPENQSMAMTSQLAESAPLPTEEAQPEITQLKISYAEVPRQLIDIWVSEGQTISQSSNTRSLLMEGTPALASFNRQDWQLFTLPGGRSLSLNSQRARDNYFRTPPNSERELGLLIEVIPGQSQAGQVSFAMQMITSLPAGADDSFSTTINANFSITSGATIILLGGLPQLTSQTEFEEIFLGTPLQILQSPEFLAGSSEFAIFIQPQ